MSIRHSEHCASPASKTLYCLAKNIERMVPKESVSRPRCRTLYLTGQQPLHLDIFWFPGPSIPTLSQLVSNSLAVQWGFFFVTAFTFTPLSFSTPWGAYMHTPVLPFRHCWVFQKYQYILLDTHKHKHKHFGQGVATGLQLRMQRLIIIDSVYRKTCWPIIKAFFI